MAKVIGNIVGVPNPKTDWNQTDPTKADCLLNKPTKLSAFKNDAGYLTEHQDISGKADKKDIEKLEEWQNITGGMINGMVESVSRLIPTIFTTDASSHKFIFSDNFNTEWRLGVVTSISFTFGDGEYADDYTSGLVFDSGATPTAIDYTDSGILNWVGTDCTTVDGLSIFQPSANTHYDIVFYFNGTQFIGLVNGYVPSVGNVVSE